MNFSELGFDTSSLGSHLLCAAESLAVFPVDVLRDRASRIFVTVGES